MLPRAATRPVSRGALARRCRVRRRPARTRRAKRAEEAESSSTRYRHTALTCGVSEDADGDLHLRRCLPTGEHLTMTRAYIGLGSNLGDRAETISEAVERLRVTPGIDAVGVSTLRETDPVGPIPDQPRFLNGVAQVETTLRPRELLDLLLELERRLGRT